MTLQAMRKTAVTVGALLVAVAATAAIAAPAKPRFDPAIGTHWPLNTTFDVLPPRAQPVRGSSCEVADRYVRIIDAGRGAEIGSLFAPDAEFLGPDDRVMRGREQIMEFFSKVPAARVAKAIPVSFIDRGRECIMELVNRTHGTETFRLLAIDHFTLDRQGRIARLVIYFRPAAIKEYGRR